MGRCSEEMIGGVVEDVAHGIFGAAHDALHAVDRAEVVAAVDALAAACADQDVLGVVGHADHFVGHDLADGEDEIESAARDEPIDLRGPRIVELAFGLFADELGRDFAEGFDVGAPVVDAEEIVRHGAEHARELVRAHGRMRAQRGQNRLEPVAVVLPRIAVSSPARECSRRLIGRNGETRWRVAELGQASNSRDLQLRGREIGIGASLGAIEAHAADSTFFSPGASRTHDEQREQINAGGDDEEDRVDRASAENVAGKGGEQRAAD